MDIEFARCLGEYLEDNYDWNIFDRSKKCSKCNKINLSDSRYCNQCGNKLEIKEEGEETGYKEILNALNHALKQTDCVILPRYLQDEDPML